jgi:hypothetical protein
MSIDWKALLILVAAYLFSRFAPVPERIKLIVFALACFGIAGLRFVTAGGAGNNQLFVLIAAGFGVFYLVRAIRLPKG